MCVTGSSGVAECGGSSTPLPAPLQLALDVSADGRYLLTTSKGFNGVGCEARVWDLRRGDGEALVAPGTMAAPPSGTAAQARAPFTGHQQDATGCAFLPRGAAGSEQAFVTASKDGSLRVWDLASGALLHERAEVRASAFTSLAALESPADGSGDSGGPYVVASSYNAGIFAYRVLRSGELLPAALSAADPAAVPREQP